MSDQERAPKASTVDSSQRLDIAFVTTRFGHQFGGAEAYGVELMRELSKRHQITVIGYEFDSKTDLKLPFIPIKNHPSLPSWVRSYLFAKQVAHVVKQHDFDIIHSHVAGWSGHIDVLHVRSARYRWFSAPKLPQCLLNYLSPRAQMYRWLEKQRIHTPPQGHTVMVSEQIKIAYKTGLDFPVIPPGVHFPIANKQHRNQIRSELNLQSDDVLCLLVARNPERKGLNTLLKSFPQLPRQVKLLVVGVLKHQLSAYEQIVAARGLADRIFFVPQCADIDAYYQAADIYVHPTLNDSFGMAPLEAMSHSLPVIMSSATHCGFAYYVQDQLNALLLDDPTDSQALSQALKSLLDDPGLFEKIARGGMHLAQQFDWSNIANRFEGLYSQAMNSRKKH